MTGWTKQGKKVHQREKIYALIKLHTGISNYGITGQCWLSKDESLKTIKTSTVRRIVNAELAKMDFIEKVGKLWYATNKDFLPRDLEIIR